jgi:hypothetical protein
VKTSKSVGQLMTALAKSQAEFPELKDDAFGYEKRYSYLTLNGIVTKLLPILGGNGIALVQEHRMTLVDDMPFVLVISRLHHGDEWVEHTLMFPLGDPVKGSTEIMQCGSVASYLRRYSLLSMLGIAGGDPEIESLNEEQTN